MAPILLSELAQSDLDDIWRYIAQERSPDIADTVLARLYGALEVLSRAPHIGKPRPEFLDTPRSFAVRPHMIFYEPLRNYGGIGVWRVLHGARDLQKIVLRPFGAGKP